MRFPARDLFYATGYGSFDNFDIPNRKRISPYPAVSVDKAFSIILSACTPLPVTTKSFKGTIFFSVFAINQRHLIIWRENTAQIESFSHHFL